MGDSNHISNNCSHQCKNVSKTDHAIEEENFDDKLRSIEETSEYLRSRTKHRPEIAVICGTGLGGLADLITDTDVFTYDQIPNFLIGSVAGHAGRLIFGKLGDKPVVCMQGRVHAYEGHSMWKMTFPVRVFGALGVKVLVATNACGGLNPSYSVDDLMIMKDHINFSSLAGLNPLVGLNDPRFGDRFVNLTNAYDKQLRKLVWRVSEELGMKFIQEGVYLCQVGPCFETVAECRMIHRMGADSIGMSTVYEVTVARQLGMRCLGLSLVTNMSVVEYDTDDVPPSHDETLDSGKRRSEDLKLLMRTVISRIVV